MIGVVKPLSKKLQCGLRYMSGERVSLAADDQEWAVTHLTALPSPCERRGHYWIDVTRKVRSSPIASIFWPIRFPSWAR